VTARLPGRLGLALGSGAARGWAHVGVIRALSAAGLTPAIVAGSSSGALVGALYAAGRLDRLEEWGRKLDWRTVAGTFDLSLRGGLIKARRLLETLVADLDDRDLRDLELPFAAVATDLDSGREVWLREGSLFDSIRAAIALPGLVTPVRLEGRWLVDGGLVNPVPVSLCRAMGADSVIAVDLNTTLLGRRAHPHPAGREEEAEAEAPGEIVSAIRSFAAELFERVSSREAGEREEPPPSFFEVATNAINIMQVRITRSRMAGDPPELLVTPRLHDFGLLDFDRAAEAIAEGERAVAQALAAGAPRDAQV
jgi:NTE family protein